MEGLHTCSISTEDLCSLFLSYGAENWPNVFFAEHYDVTVKFNKTLSYSVRHLC